MAEGCHNLLKTGAALVSSADDVLAVLNIAAIDHKPTIMAATPEEQVILELLVSGMHDADELLAAANLPVHIFNQTLTMLEITGKITPRGGNTWYLT
jgi:predicted Rossmann fold nucleotide-binding protein DprA/Smf involved in DNA uptake